MTTPTDDVTFVHPALTLAKERYVAVRDCVEQRVKDKTTVYLPVPSVGDVASSSEGRYAAYLLRAVFYAVTSRTLLGMIGQTYARPPEVKLPASLEFMRDDATGSGLSLHQLSIDTMANVMATGRAGLYVDFPETSGPITVAEMQSGEFRPTITSYAPEAIINWRTTKRNSKHVLALVVLCEEVDIEGNFSKTTELQYRELRLIDGAYTVRVWKETDNGFTIISESQPRDGNGKTFDELPFTFVGATNNDTEVDEPPLYDLAALNIAHYRNSADYEESVFITGQPTPWFSGLTEEWVTDVMKGEVLLGSRAAVLLPQNGQAGLLQVGANSMPMEAMKHKETQMVALGARLVENRAVRRTLGEVQQSNASETSILASCANNVSAAYEFALRQSAKFVLADGEACEFKLNTDFALTPMDAADRMQLIADMQGGALSLTEVRAQLRKVGIATQDDTTAIAEITAREQARTEQAIKPSNIDNRAK